MTANYIIPRLSYEILNVSLEEIASSLGLTVPMIQEIADKQKWKQWFKDEDSAFSLEDVSEDEESNLLEGEDIFSVQADRFLDKNRKRLQVFSMAKELAMAEQYANLEVSVVEKAREAVLNLDSADVKSLRDIASIFKDLAKNISSMSTAISMGKDDTGLPTLILRDLSGT